MDSKKFLWFSKSIKTLIRATNLALQYRSTSGSDGTLSSFLTRDSSRTGDLSALTSREGAMTSREGVAEVVVGAGVAIVMFLLSGILESNSVEFWKKEHSWLSVFNEVDI